MLFTEDIGPGQPCIFDYTGATPPCISDSGEPVKLHSLRIQELEQQMAQRSRMLTESTQALITEIRHREKAQASLIEAQGLESIFFLAAGLAHDLSNVLGAMSIGYELLEKQPNQAVLQRIAGNGHLAIKQGRQLIANLMDFMRTRSTAPALIAPNVFLVELDTLLGYAGGRHIVCRVQAAPEVWPVRAEVHRLSSALINLVVNARDAMPDGGTISVVAINVTEDTQRPAQVPAGEFVVFCVTDTGCGMTPQVLAQATKPLFSTKVPGTGTGTGLGLHMVKTFADDSSGYLHIESQSGVGTRVSLYLPRCEDNASATEKPVNLPLGDIPCNVVLLVTGDDMVRQALAADFYIQGFRVSEAKDGEQALTMLPTMKELVLVVADVALPDGNGAALVQLMRQERPGLPALLLSHKSMSESPMPGVPVLLKNLNSAQLQTAVQEQLRQPVSARDKVDAMLERLMQRLRSPGLLTALLAWREARGSAFLPLTETIRGIAPDLVDSVFIAAREGTEQEPTFRFESIGRLLLEKLGPVNMTRTIAAPDESLIGTLAGAYRRAAATGLPSYEYAPYALGDGLPITFERLLLPASSDGQRVSHLLGIVLFTNLPTPVNTSPES